MADYAELSRGFTRFLGGELSAEELKTVAAPLGIYQQRDGRFMVRVRINGGQVDVESLAGIAGVLARVGGRAHLTSRQDLQLHGLPDERVMEAVEAVDRLGWPFKGGGGNTYRNTVVGAWSGLSPDTVFDVYPYADALNRAMLACKEAYALPRKFKVGLYASEADALRAAVHDLGFVARMCEGRRGFRVIAGGGMGRESSAGVCLADFLPAEKLLRAALALVALFYDHGDRANRHQARLRFVLKRLGREAFERLFWTYYEKDSSPDLLPGESLEGAETQLCDSAWAAGSAAESGGEAFARWSACAVSPTRLAGVVSVRLFVPYGDLSPDQLGAVARLARDAGSAFVRLLPTQDVLVPFVRGGDLPRVYARLCGELADVDLTFRSYRGHIVTCVGARVCKIGMVDAPAVADRLASALDAFLPADTPARAALQRLATDEVRISGCPNACAGHPAARFGLGCQNQRIGGEVVACGRLFLGAGATAGEARLSEATSDEPCAVEALVADELRALTAAAGLRA